MEFKNFAKLDLNTAVEYICAFLNSYGGTILFGVNDEGIVKGLFLTRKDIDTFQVDLDIALRDFRPTVFPDQVRVHFHEVCLDQHYVIVNRYVLQIDVFADFNQKFYLTERNEMFIRKQGSINRLSMPEVIQFVLKRSQSFIDSSLPNPCLNPQIFERMSQEDLTRYAELLDNTSKIVKKYIKSK